MKTYVKVKNIVKDRQYIVAEPELNVHYLAFNSLIKFQGKLYTCVKDTTWTGILNDDWKEYSPTPDTSKFVQVDGDLTNGKIWTGDKASYDAIAVKDPNTMYYVEYPGQVTSSNFHNRVYWHPSVNYLKDQIIYIRPSDYGVQDTGAVVYPLTIPAGSTYTGQSKIYNIRVTYKNYDICLRALSDNPKPPSETDSIGVYWEIVDPDAIVETGKDTTGSITYKITAGGTKHVWWHKNSSITVSNPVVFPVRFDQVPFIGTQILKNTSNNWHIGGIAGQNLYLKNMTNSQCFYTMDSTMSAIELKLYVYGV